MILTIFAEQTGTLHFSVTERDVVKINQNQDAYFSLIIVLLIQLLISLRLSSLLLPPWLQNKNFHFDTTF